MNSRLLLHDDATTNFRILTQQGDRWGEEFFATGVAIGRTRHASGRQRTIGITRMASVNHRFQIHEYDV